MKETEGKAQEGDVPFMMIEESKDDIDQMEVMDQAEDDIFSPKNANGESPENEFPFMTEEFGKL